MRYSQFFAPTLRDDPADAEVISHKLLLRAGYIRRVTSGVYDFLPLGLKVLRKIEQVVREEMDHAGAQELLMPTVQPAELWQRSGRWEKYGKELLRFNDRHGHESCLGPTHEEVVCDLMARELRSYKQLPINLYQIQSKFRDEVRPRFGLMRGREFIMKDAYSFHADEACLKREYDNMFATYQRIFTRLGLKFRAVQADNGSIGGTASHEFHVLADSGEDAIAHCSACDYAANVELAVSKRHMIASVDTPLQEVETVQTTAVVDVAALLGVDAAQMVKTMVYRVQGGEHDGAVVVVCVRGDDCVQEMKLTRFLGADDVRLADDGDIEKIGGVKGYVGPQGLQGVQIVIDESLHEAVGLVAGANVRDRHVQGLNMARDIAAAVYTDVREARAGDQCFACDHGVIEISRGIEVGHVFALGQVYAEPMGVMFQNQDGKRATATMGCYGIGVSRLMAAIVEQCNDEKGIVWPAHLSPFDVVVISVGKSTEVEEAAAALYGQLQAAGYQVLWDERNERPGVKFKDAELMGLPVSIVVGDRGLEKGTIEVRVRASGEQKDVTISACVEAVQESLTHPVF
ncbi:MAG: proline--tRNA ligase [Zetaproteobacteria bacterium]|nr:proline--tRNA ligase [Zetaproteobacteria bacterium]